MPVSIVGRQDPESFDSTAFVGFGGRAIAYSPALGIAASTTAIGQTLRFSISSFEDATNVKFCIYNATTRALLEEIIVPSTIGTGLHEIAMAGTTMFQAGEFYKICVYNNAPSEQIVLNVDSSGRQIGFVTGDFNNPTDPIQSEPFFELLPGREWFWEVLGDSNQPDDNDILRDIVNDLINEII